MSVLIRIVVYAASLWVAVALLDGLTLIEGNPLSLLAIALIMGVVNVVVKPILSLLSLPFILLTFGLFLLVVNAIVLSIVLAISGALGLGLESASFWWTMGGAFVISLVSWGLESLLGTR